jgi:phosphonate transport system substrate-binding protein
MKKLFAVLLLMVVLFLHFDFAQAEEWRKKYPTVTFGVCTLNKETIALSKHIVDYLSEQTGVNVVLHTRPDYGGMIDDVAAGNVQFLACGPLPYATTYDRMKGDLEPLAMEVTKSNQKGYHIVMTVKSDSPYETLDDLRGKTFAVPDPNSTSSYTLPRAYMDPDRPFFGSIKVSGSHGKGILGVVKGIYDCAVTWAYSEESGKIAGMTKKGQINKGDVRIIWWSPLVPNHCVAAVSSLPKEMKRTFQQALLEFRETDPERFSQHNPGLSRYVSADHENYRFAFEIRENQKRSSQLLR